MRTATLALLLATLPTFSGCAVNPATGQRQLDLIGESREIEIGRSADPDIVASMGEVEDPELNAYVSRIGNELAAASERPGLPWSFTVLDDPLVNAFALPGGYVYVTRGILAHFESEAELAGVLGHEIGHVTARHGVSRMSRTVLQQLGLGVGKAVSKDIREYAQLFEVGLGLINLSYSRDEETQSDELGVRYMTRSGYDPGAMEGVFRMLASVSGSPGSRIPEWQASHPYPENREAHIRDLVAALPPGLSTTKVERDAYLDRVQGMVYGANPREGYFNGRRFLHPEMAFQLIFPEGWKGENRRTMVAAQAPDQDGLVALQLAGDATDPRAALQAFLDTEGITGGPAAPSDRGGLTGWRAPFTAVDGTTAIAGEVLFVAHGGRVFQVMGASSQGAWPTRRPSVQAALASFQPLTDARVLAVQPWRLEVTTLPTSMTLRAFHQRYPSPVSVEELAAINRVGVDDTLPQGTRLKRVTGEPLP